ncbi:hypothetical protein [Pelosinus sp. IPA-1]|uniref:hypothetical protein n=1 Tax=Pelosinus sp. IPA-1 TaxID=3029569 RepID=UPI0024361DF0|nr:hypothetical protein [Pelosinus sp. IPA-1]GMA99527.1 hypothetical protein PIPA1_23270 [Pelosinus sp. IPA-1]
MDLFEVDSANIEPIVEEYLYEYYNDNLTIFTSTTFPRTDKVDLAALAIANSLTDDYTANKTVEKFKSRLHDYIKSPSNLAEQVFGRKKKSIF